MTETYRTGYGNGMLVLTFTVGLMLGAVFVHWQLEGSLLPGTTATPEAEPEDPYPFEVEVSEGQTEYVEVEEDGKTTFFTFVWASPQGATGWFGITIRVRDKDRVLGEKNLLSTTCSIDG